MSTINRFSETLKDVLEARSMTPSELARSLKKKQSTIHPYLTGEYPRPTREFLKQLAEIFKPAEFVEILISHLRDETPEKAAKWIAIIAANTKLGEETTSDIFDQLPPTLRKDFEFLAERAIKSASVRAVIEANAAAFR